MAEPPHRPPKRLPPPNRGGFTPRTKGERSNIKRPPPVPSWLERARKRLAMEDGYVPMPPQPAPNPPSPIPIPKSIPAKTPWPPWNRPKQTTVLPTNLGGGIPPFFPPHPQPLPTPFQMPAPRPVPVPVPVPPQPPVPAPQQPQGTPEDTSIMPPLADFLYRFSTGFAAVRNRQPRGLCGVQAIVDSLSFQRVLPQGMPLPSHTDLIDVYNRELARGRYRMVFDIHPEDASMPGPYQAEILSDVLTQWGRQYPHLPPLVLGFYERNNRPFSLTAPEPNTRIVWIYNSRDHWEGLRTWRNDTSLTRLFRQYGHELFQNEVAPEWFIQLVQRREARIKAPVWNPGPFPKRPFPFREVNWGSHYQNEGGGEEYDDDDEDHVDPLSNPRGGPDLRPRRGGY
ncbi:hypothetical protein F4811DRAFT_556240 [Daldinia bambusicola]|nr:hypothetical protein F4811DRAFT_556240 [Daldinia bambusicola]